VVEAEKCITVIQQLDINKIRTRTRHSNDFAKYKLTLDELDLFVQEIDNLCCIIDDGISVKELQQMGYEFVANVKRVLNDESVADNSIDELSRLIQDGNSLCIELPQLEQLKARMEQVQWYRTVRDYREKQEAQQMSQLKKLLLEGMKIPPHYTIEREMSEIQAIIQNTEAWEDTVRQFLESQVPIKLEDIESLLERGKAIDCYLPSFAQLKEALTRAKECLEHLEALQSNDSYPYLETVEYVMNRSRCLPFLLEPIQRYEEHVSEAKLWKERACQTFLKKNSKFTLLEALTPKYDSDLTFAAYPPTPSPVNNPGEFSPTVPPTSSPISSSTSTSSTISAISSSSSADSYMEEDLGPAVVVATFKKAEENEVTRITEIRRKNSQKHPERDAYCLCKARFSGKMLHCAVCLDWFHASCCLPGKTKKSEEDVGPWDKYLCQLCQRTKRPKLETILALLVSLQKIPLRVPEGEALQCVTERAMGWQDRVKQALARKDVALALAKLSVQHQKKFEGEPETKAGKKQKNLVKQSFKKLLAAAKANLSPTGKSGESAEPGKEGEDKGLMENFATLTPSSSETSDPENLSDLGEDEDGEQIPKT
jgi:histone demethylase JARID1